MFQFFTLSAIIYSPTLLLCLLLSIALLRFTSNEKQPITTRTKKQTSRDVDGDFRLGTTVSN